MCKTARAKKPAEICCQWYSQESEKMRVMKFYCQNTRGWPSINSVSRNLFLAASTFVEVFKFMWQTAGKDNNRIACTLYTCPERRQLHSLLGALLQRRSLTMSGLFDFATPALVSRARIKHFGS